jgi:nicotinamidase-related amidase
VFGFDDMEGTIEYLISAAKALGVPIVITEQVPTKLGRTTAALLGAAGLTADANGELMVPPDVLLVDKTRFSMATPVVTRWLGDRRIRRAVLVGAETHVCIAQTARDLAGNGVSVDIIAEGVSSIRVFDRSTALRRMAAQGAAGLTVSSAEAAVFEWLGDATHPAFKQVQALVKAYSVKATAHALTALAVA